MEFSLILPTLLLMFLGVVDAGIYVYSFVSVQNAARAAAVRNSGGKESAADQTRACSMAADQLRGLPMIGSSYSGACTSSPLVVTSTFCDGPDACGRSATTADSQPATLVTVSYTLPSLFQLPFGNGLTAISISSEMKLRNAE